MYRRQKTALTLLAFLSLLFLLLWLGLPRICNRYLLPYLVREMPLPHKELSLSRLSLSTIQGSAGFTDENKQKLTIPRFELRYAPEQLFTGTVTSLFIDSLSIDLHTKDGIPRVQGLKGPSHPQDRPTAPAVPLVFPIGIEKIIAQNCSLNLYTERGVKTFIFDTQLNLHFEPEKTGGKKLTRVTGNILVRGELQAHAFFEFTSKENDLLLELRLTVPEISQLARLAPEPVHQQISGKMQVDAEFHLNQDLVFVHQLTTVRLEDFSWQDGQFTLQHNKNTRATSLQLEGDGRTCNYSLQGLELISPIKVDLASEGLFNILDQKLSGTTTCILPELEKPLRLKHMVERQEQHTSVRYTLLSEKQVLQKKYQLGPTELTGNLILQNTTINGEMDGSLDWLKIDDNQLLFSGINLHLPLNFPFSDKQDVPGRLSVEGINYQGQDLGNIDTLFTRLGETTEFDLVYQAAFSPDLALGCHGSTTGFNPVVLDCKVEKTLIDQVSLAPFLQTPEKLSFSGFFQAEGQFLLDDLKPSGSLTAQISEMALQQGENQVQGLACKFYLPRLPLLESAPHQRCSVDRIDLGKLHFTNGKIQFRTEANKSLFIEKTGLNWCGGHVEGNALTISAQEKSLDTILYCDRIGFAELLNQFGLENGEGQGSLNGRLPVTFSSEGVRFDDGFLFSTPGESGIVRFKKSGQLRNVLSAAGQQPYLDYSMQALENFAYNWTKLSFNSIDNELLMKVQLDGKPVEPLPFGYKKGQIVPNANGQGIQHPIRLDINFRLPLQELFQYGQDIQSIMENS